MELILKLFHYLSYRKVALTLEISGFVFILFLFFREIIFEMMASKKSILLGNNCLMRTIVLLVSLIESSMETPAAVKRKAVWHAILRDADPE